MIKILKLDGYRLLDGFTADLGQLTVIIGANATGKSSLIDALSLVTDAADWPIEDVLFRRNGMISILNASRDCKEFGWEITFAKPASHPVWPNLPMAPVDDLKYECRLGRDSTGRPLSLYESLRLAEPKPGHSTPLKLFEVQGSRAVVFNRKTRKLEPFDEPADISTEKGRVPATDRLEVQGLPSQKLSLFLSQMRFVNEYPTQTWVRALFNNFHYYPAFDVGAGSPVRTKLAEIKANTILDRDGNNLGTVLHEILTRNEFRATARELQEFLKSAFPHVEDISAETAFGGEPRILVRIREAGLHRPTEIWELSDGMLRFLLLCAALLNPVPPALVAIDEPEAGLHPKLLPIVADMIRSASEHSQVLVTTHSPLLLSAFDLDDVAVMTRFESRANWWRPRDRSSLREMLEAQLGSTLGELHATGELEAMP